jgi:Flp pilus assembly protein TadG
MGRRRCAPARRASKPARSRNERGVSAVEFALVLPILVMLLFGVTTTGLAYNDHISISNAVREGARLGSSLDYSTAPATWATSVQSRVQQVYFNSASDLPTSDICVALVKSDGTVLASTSGYTTNCGTVPSSPSSMATGSCVVKVWVQKPAHVSLIITPDWNFNIGAQSVSYYGLVAGTCTATP